MTSKAHSRTIKLIGRQGLDRLQAASVAVVGLGGVGGSAAEALLRSGVGQLHLYDRDVVDESNLNRQLFATHDKLGQPKAYAAKERLLAIMPGAEVYAYNAYIRQADVDKVVENGYTYIIDAIDSMQDKIALINAAYHSGAAIISATGAGNRLRADKLRCADVYETSGDPLCRILRQQLKKLGIKRHSVVYSEEAPGVKATPPGSMAFVPNAMGIMLANKAVLDILGDLI